MLVLSAIWFGCLNSAREVVKELPVYLIERSVSLGIGPYLTSKLVPLAVLAAFHLPPSHRFSHASPPAAFQSGKAATGPSSIISKRKIAISGGSWQCWCSLGVAVYGLQRARRQFAPHIPLRTALRGEDRSSGVLPAPLLTEGRGSCYGNTTM